MGCRLSFFDALGGAAAIGVPLLKPRSRRSVPERRLRRISGSNRIASRISRRRARIQFGCVGCKAARPDHAVFASPVGVSAPRPGRRMSAGDGAKYRNSKPSSSARRCRREEFRACDSRQLAALRFTPFRSATVDSFLSAAFSSLRLVVKSRTRSSRPSSSAQAIRVP